MKRVERAKKIIHLLQHSLRPISSLEMAELLQVSQRTIYRDIALLCSKNIPIRGEAGSGYLLPSHNDIHPIIFTIEELRVIVLGITMVSEKGDPRFMFSLKNLLLKIEASLPPHLYALIKPVT